MNFYQFNEKLKKQKLNESFLGNMGQAVGNIGNMIGQNFLQGTKALQTSNNQGWQQIQQAQNSQQNKIDAKAEKDVAAHLGNVASKLGLNPKELEQEIQSFVKKINELKTAKEAAEKEQAPAAQETGSKPNSGGASWSDL